MEVLFLSICKNANSLQIHSKCLLSLKGCYFQALKRGRLLRLVVSQPEPLLQD